MLGVCNPGKMLPISTAPAVEPAMMDRKALGFSFVSISVPMEYRLEMYETFGFCSDEEIAMLALRKCLRRMFQRAVIY